MIISHMNKIFHITTFREIYMESFALLQDTYNFLIFRIVDLFMICYSHQILKFNLNDTFIFNLMFKRLRVAENWI